MSYMKDSRLREASTENHETHPDFLKVKREKMYPICFIVMGGRSLLPPWLHVHLADAVSYFVNLVLQANVLFWLQMTIVVIGTGWCLALMGVACFGGWYARTHSTAKNDQVARRLIWLLWLLTFGLTDKSSSPVKSLDSGQEDGHQRNETLRSSGRCSRS